MPSPIAQLLSRTEYAGDGVTTSWEFSFSGGYLDRTHVKAYTETSTGFRTPLTIMPGDFTGDYTLNLGIVPVDTTLLIYRDTPKDLPLVDFVDGGRVTEASLDLIAKQAVFIAAETVDTVNALDVAAAVDAAEDAALSAIAAAASALAAANSAIDAAAYAAAAAGSADTALAERITVQGLLADALTIYTSIAAVQAAASAASASASAASASAVDAAASASTATSAGAIAGAAAANAVVAGKAALGGNSDITSLAAASLFAYNGNTQITLSTTAGDVAFGGAPYGSQGVSLNSAKNLSFSESAGSSLAGIFRQNSNGSLILGSGVKYSATANAFASSTSNNWSRAAVEVGYYGIKFYHNALQTVGIGNDVAMEEQVRFSNNGLQYSSIPGYSGLYDQFMCRARCMFNVVSGTVTLGTDAGNVTSITDFGVGDFGVNFSTTMPDTKYTFVGSAGNVNVGSNPYVVSEQSRSASQLRLTVYWVTNGAVDPNVVNVAIFR